MVLQRWLIVYSSNTGNTKKVAEAMYKALAKDESDICSLKEFPDDTELAEYDVIAVGYWLTRGGPDALTKKFLSRITNQKVVLFQTHGTEVGSEHSVTAFARAASCLGNDCDILGTFACQGKINPALLSRRASIPADDPHAPNARNLKRWEAASQHPDQKDLDNVVEFIEAVKRKLKLREKYLAKRK